MSVQLVRQWLKDSASKQPDKTQEELLLKHLGNLADWELGTVPEWSKIAQVDRMPPGLHDIIDQQSALELIVSKLKEGGWKKYASQRTYETFDIRQGELFGINLAKSRQEAVNAVKELLILIEYQASSKRGEVHPYMLEEKRQEMMMRLARYRELTGRKLYFDSVGWARVGGADQGDEGNNFEAVADGISRRSFSGFIRQMGTELAALKNRPLEQQIRILDGLSEDKLHLILVNLSEYLHNTRLPSSRSEHLNSALPYQFLGLIETVSNLKGKLMPWKATESLDSLAVQANGCFIDDIVDDTAACVFGPEGHSRKASLAYVLDDNIRLLSLTPYSNGRQMDAIAKAILVKTKDEKDEDILVVDGVVGGPAADVSPISDVWSFMMLSGILKYANESGFKRLVVNASHKTRGTVQESVHEFTSLAFELSYPIRIYQQQDDAAASVHRRWKLEVERRESQIGRKLRSSESAAVAYQELLNSLPSSSRFTGTHTLNKPPMNPEVVKKIGRNGYKGEHYLDAWYEWNRHSGRENPQWNLAEGPVIGIEINVRNALDFIGRQGEEKVLEGEEYRRFKSAKEELERSLEESGSIEREFITTPDRVLKYIQERRSKK